MLENAFAVNLSKKDFGAMFRGTLLNGMFQFSQEMKEAMGYELADPYKNNTELKQWAEFIGQSDQMIDLIHGGNKSRVENLMVFIKEGREDVIVVEKKGEQYSLTHLENKEALAPTVAYAYGTYVKEGVMQWLKESMGLENYLFVVHLIDMYRRIQYRTMMDYQKLKSFRMTFAELMEHFSNSIKSKDARWMLPTFVYFTELFARYNVDMTLEKLEQLTKMGIVKMEKSPNGQDIIVFTDKMVAFADECLNHWINCSCIQLTRLIGSDVKRFNPLFVIHTRKGNYVTTINNQGMVSNKAIDLSEFMKVMENLLH